ncbi:MAG: DUF4097 domain-containing protein [Clostridia bacterium]|nr:DUF4097 domain-containing protein [Clostridia bacterium]
MKAWKVFLGIGAGVLVIGLIVMLIGLGLNDWSFKVEYEMKTFNSEQETTTLDLSLAAGEMNVVYYEGENIEVNYPTSYKYGYEVSERNGTLTVEPQQHFGVWFGFGWNKVPAVTVKIPKGKVMDLKLDLSAGVARVEDCSEFGNVRVRLSAGWADLGSMVCNKFNASLSAGKLDVDRVECSDFDLHLSAGVANVDFLKCDDISVKLSAGTASVTVLGNKSDYSISVDRSAGSCNVSNQTGAVVGKTIDVDLSAGSVSVEFTD